MRRTSVFTLEVTPAEVTPGAADRKLDMIITLIDRAGVTRVGSGARGAVRYVMFRVADDAAAVAVVNSLGNLKNATLSTGQGTHNRIINLEGTKMATKYDVQLDDGTSAGIRARKDAAMKLGDASGVGYRIVSTVSGEVVHQVEAPAPANTQKENDVSDTATTPEVDEDIVGTPTPAKKTAAKKAPAKSKAAAKEEPAAEPAGPSIDVEFEGLGKYYARAAGLHGAEVIGKVFGVEASIKGTTITLHGEDEDTEQVAAHLRALWPAAKLAHREYRKNDKVYSEIDKSRQNKEANAQRWDLEVAWFQTFMDGAADALADTVKRKGGAYKDGVTAIQNPAPDEDADVI